MICQIKLQLYLNKIYFYQQIKRVKMHNLLDKSKKLNQKHWCGDFPGGAVVKNLPAIAGDTGSSPGLGRSHMPWSN